MRNTHAVEVDGQAYSVTYFSATKSLEVLIELSKIAGVPIASMFSEEGDMMDVDLGKVLPTATKALVQSLDKVGTVALIKTVLDSVSKDNQPVMPTFDVLFAGKPGHLLKLFGKTIQIQYGDLKNVLGALAQLQATAKAE